MPLRDRSDHPFAARSPAIQPGHRRGGEGLVNEDQFGRFQCRLFRVPGVTGQADVFPGLLGGSERFF